MSKVIKAAQLKVLIGASEDIFRSVADEPSRRTLDNGEEKNGEYQAPSNGGTILESTALLEEAQARAAALLEDAEAEAAAVVEKAERESSEKLEVARLQAKEEGYQAGYTEGLTAGTEAARDEVAEQAASLLSLLQNSVEEAAAQRGRSLALLEEDFLKLAVILAEKIMRREVDSDMTWLQPLIGEALNRMANAEDITIHVSPPDYECVSQGMRAFSHIKSDLHWNCDESMSVGSFFIETEYGAIDGSLEHRLGKLAAALLDVMYNG